MVANTIAQFINKEKTFNYKKVLSYGSFSLLVSGPLYHYWYILLDKIFKGKTGKLYIILQLLIDQAIFSPFYFVLFYVYMALLQGTLSTIKKEIRENLIPSSISSATVWVPVQFITFKYIPPHLRVLWNNIVALGWNIYFSLYNSKKSSNA